MSAANTQLRLDEARRRLARLEGFLREDPGNAPLLADAFQAALACGEWGSARAHLDRAQSAHPGDPAWALREGDFWLAQQRYEDARAVLIGLAESAAPGSAFAAAVDHNLAYIDFRLADYAACVARLEPWLAGGSASRDGAGAMQQLWLRALHRADQRQRACEWAAQAEQAGVLDPAAAGIAALAAIDHGDFAAAQRWADVAKASQGAPTMEALVARSTLALAGRDGPAAQQLADQALSIQDDGRAWSARGFASLLAGDLPVARHDFLRAVALMSGHIGTWHGLGWTQLLQHDLSGARASFETALGLDRNFAESHGGLAVILALQKQTHAAHEHIEVAQRLDRANLSSRYAQALLSGEAQDAQAIQRLAQRLLASRKAPLGEQMSDWLPGNEPPKH